MFNAHRYLTGVLLAMTLALVTPACASNYPAYRYPGVGNVDERAYNRGYQEGRSNGESDARRNRSFDYDRHSEYRDADDGFRGGNRNAYRDLFRRGFVEGYNDGYRQYARNGYPGYPSGRYPSTTYPTYPQYPTYPYPESR